MQIYLLDVSVKLTIQLFLLIPERRLEQQGALQLRLPRRRRKQSSSMLSSYLDFKVSTEWRFHWMLAPSGLVALLGLIVPVSPGHEPQKSLLRGLRFFCIFEKSGKNEATDLASAVRGSTIAIISAHVLALTCGRVQARARVQVLQNSASQMVVLRFTTLSARDR